MKPALGRQYGDGIHASVADLHRLKHQGQGFSFLPHGPIHSMLAGQKISRLRGRGLNFEEIRNYLPGDDIRNIDWKVTARMRKPHTRVYTEERDRPTLLVVDQRINMFFGSKRAMKSVVAAEAAALGAWRVVSVGDRVGAVVFNDTEIETVRPHRSTKTVMNILSSVSRMNNALNAQSPAEPNPAQLNKALESVCRLAKHDYLVCIVSDLDGADQLTRKLATRLARRNDVLVCFVHDALEAEIPDLGRVVLGDGRNQIEFDTSDASLREKYRNVFSEKLEQAQKFLLQRQVPVITLDTELPVAAQLRRALGFKPKLATG